MEPVNTLDIMQTGEIKAEGRLAWGSNYTLLGYACKDDVEVPVVYKPRRGERPLWDFPTGTLCSRERAAYLVSEAAEWHVVPTTILRDGPYGHGSVQAFIEHDPEMHYFSIQGESRYDAQLQSIVLFDWVTNNADRKGGHVLVDPDDQLWAIDHGICFNVEYKLRSVIWDFAGMPFSAEQSQQLQTLKSAIGSGAAADELADLLTASEIEIMKRSLDLLIDAGVFPEPGPGRHYPWPPV